MRTLSRMSAELSNLELGLDLELNSDDVAAAEAAVAAHGESLICSCCDLELTDKESLHLHQISQHSISQLSIALLSLRGFILDTELPQDLCHRDSESESTVSAHSSFMFEFVDEFKNTILQNQTSTLSGADISDAGTYGCGDTQCASLSNASHYSCDYPGSLKYDGNNTSVGSICMDINSNHQSVGESQVKVRYNGTDLRQGVAENSFLTNTGDMSKTDSNQTASTFFHDFQEIQQKEFQKSVKKRTQPTRKRKTTTTNNIAPTSSGNPQLTCSKTSSKVGPKQTGDYELRDFSCEICGRRYKRKSHLGRHIRMHSGVRPYPCTLCDKRFAVRSILKQHMRVHTGERPFKCLVCCQRFPQKSGLVTHMMLHTGKPYKCDLCDKSFVSNHKLSVHKKAHEEQSGRWPTMGPHACPTCSTRFFTSSALAEHAKVHIVASPSISQPGFESTSLSNEAVPVNGRYHSADGDRIANDVNVMKHNSQEVTAGQALLTLMDSNDVDVDEEEHLPSVIRTFSENSDTETSEVPIHFEFCDVPLDCKSSVYLKEECFGFDDNLTNASQYDRPENN